MGPLRHLVATAVEAGTRLHRAKTEYRVTLAAIARAARGEGRVEAREIRRKAKALGVTRQMMQVYGVVGSEWTATELRVLLDREDCRGNRISVSHLLVLARLPSAERAQRTEEVFDHGLNLKDLRRRIRGIDSA